MPATEPAAKVRSRCRFGVGGALASLTAAGLVQAVMLWSALGGPDGEVTLTSAGAVESAYRGAVLAPVQPDSFVVIDPNRNGGSPVGPGAAGVGRMVTLLIAFADLPAERAPLACLVIVAAATPLLLMAGAGAGGFSATAAALAPWFGVAIFWYRPNRGLIEAGYFELALFSPLAATYVAALHGFHRRGSAISWLTLVLAGLIGWTIIPTVWTIFALLGIIGWLLVAHRHDVNWHGLAALATLLAIVPIMPAVVDLSRHPESFAQLTEWLPDSPRDAADPVGMALASIFLGITFARLRLVSDQQGSATTWLTTLAAFELAGGMALHKAKLASVGTLDFLMFQSLVLLLLPTAETLSSLGAAGVALLGLAVTALGLQPPLSQNWGAARIATGWNASESQWLDTIRSTVRPSSRLLWESANSERISPAWTPLTLQVPVLAATGDDSWALADGQLSGRSITDLSDDDLRRTFERWNVGWVRVAHPATAQRLDRFPGANRWPGPSTYGTLFSLDRLQAYFLKGRGHWQSATANEIVLGDVYPDAGEVILSLRYDANWLPSPSRITIEPEFDAFDPIPLMRLRIDGPISRVVLRRNPKAR